MKVRVRICDVTDDGQIAPGTVELAEPVLVDVDLGSARQPWNIDESRVFVYPDTSGNYAVQLTRVL